MISIRVFGRIMAGICACLLLAVFVASAEVENETEEKVEKYEEMAEWMALLNKEKKYGEVIEAYEKHAVPENRSYAFYKELGEAYFRNEIKLYKVKQGDKVLWYMAERHFLRALEIKPGDLYITITLAKLFTWTKDYYSANHYARRYLELGGKYWEETAKTILEKYKYTPEKEEEGDQPK